MVGRIDARQAGSQNQNIEVLHERLRVVGKKIPQPRKRASAVSRLRRASFSSPCRHSCRHSTGEVHRRDRRHGKRKLAPRRAIEIGYDITGTLYQFSIGTLRALSTTSTSNGSLRGVSLRPSSSWMAV